MRKSKNQTRTARLRFAGAIPAPAAGDWLGIVIFLVIAIVSILGKLQESKKKDGEDESLDSPSIEPEDLPEPIRRMLYGDRDRPVRTAKPAQSAASKRMEAESAAAPPAPAPDRRPTPRPVTVAPPRAKTRPTPIPVAQQSTAPTPPRPAAPRIPEDDETRPRMQPLIQKPTPPRPKIAVAPQAKPATPSMARPPEAAQLIKAARAADASVKPIANPWLFKDKADLRRAIVLSEILAPPLALRELP